MYGTLLAETSSLYLADVMMTPPSASSPKQGPLFLLTFPVTSFGRTSFFARFCSVVEVLHDMFLCHRVQLPAVQYNMVLQ